MGRKKGNSGKGCTLQRQRSISGFHFVLGVLRRLHVTQLHIYACTHSLGTVTHARCRGSHTTPHFSSSFFSLPFFPISILVPPPANRVRLSPFIQLFLRVDLSRVRRKGCWVVRRRNSRDIDKNTRRSIPTPTHPREASPIGGN